MQTSHVLTFVGAALLIGCTPVANDGNGAASSASSMSSRSSVSSASSVTTVSSEASSSTSSKKVTADDPFQEYAPGDFAGTVTISGYATTKVMDEFFCTENCRKYTYVNFNIIEGETPALTDFLKDMEGSSFGGLHALGLGCAQADGTLYYFNLSNVGGEFTIPPADADVILQSTKEHPVTIVFRRGTDTPGREVPNCYAHFTYSLAAE